MPRFLNKRKSIANRFNGPLYIRLFRPTPAVRKWIEYKTLNELTASNTFSDAEREKIHTIFHEIEDNVSDMEHLLETLRNDFPISYRHAVTAKALRMLLCERHRTWTHFADMGMITEKELSDQLDEISQLPHADSMFKRLMNLIRKAS